MSFKRILITGFACTSIAATAQTFNKPKLDSLMDALAAGDRSMISVAIAKNGQLLYSRAIGFAGENSDGSKIKSTPKTGYRIGSITKIFTAAMIFRAVEEKKLTLATTLATYYPAIPNADRITIGQLLGHRSGIHNFTNDSDYTTYYQQPKTESEMVALIAAKTPDFTPDSTASYSNSNYVLLGYILERVYKQPYKNILAEKIVQKAGLKETYCGGKFNPQKGEARSYQYGTGWVQEKMTDLSIPGGAGAVIATPADLTRFIDALFAGKIISKASLEQMKTMKDHHGMGMFSFPFGDRTFYGHSGGIDGFQSLLGKNTEDGMTLAYCTNGTRTSGNDIAIGLLSIAYNEAYNIPEFTNYTVKNEDLDQYAGVYSSAAIPLKVTITKEDGVLNAQATGQSAFALEPQAKDKFKFDPAKIVIEFKPETKEMTLIQGGRAYPFKKE